MNKDGYITERIDLSEKLDVESLMNFIVWGNSEGEINLNNDN